LGACEWGKGWEVAVLFVFVWQDGLDGIFLWAIIDEVSDGDQRGYKSHS